MKTDILSYLRQKLQNRVFFGFFLFFCFEPILNAIIGRWLKGKWFMGDFDAVACGAHRLSQGLSPYIYGPSCEGLKPATYVYAPQFGSFIAPLVEYLGPDHTRLLYAVFLIPATLLLLWYMVLKPLPNGPIELRLLSLMAVRGTPLATGNLGGVLHGAIVLAALFLMRWRWLFIAVVLGASLIKPFFLSALLVLLYEDRPFLRRLMTFVPAFVIGIALNAYISLTAGPMGAEWNALLLRMIAEDPGRGFFSGMVFMGLEPSGAFALGLLALYAVIMVGAGLIISTFGGLNASERVLLGLGIGQFINPRLFDYNYDVFVFYPTVIVVIMLLRPINPEAFKRLGWIFGWTILANFLISVIGIKWIKNFPGTFIIFSAMILYVSFTLARLNRAAIDQAMADPKQLWQNMTKALVASLGGKNQNDRGQMLL